MGLYNYNVSKQFSTQGLHFFLRPLTLPRSCCSSIWMSMILLLSSSLVGWTDSAITSDLSGFLPFLRGGATGGVAEDIALRPPNQDRHRVPGALKRRRVSHCSSSLPCIIIQSTSLLEDPGSFYYGEKNKQTRGKEKKKRVSQC